MSSELPFKAGAIRRIKLENFMCHESFELEFGPRVNFVIGPNGSGKSALLTALVVVLGGRATTTSRAKKASEFVKYGKKYARITCVLHNYDKVLDRDRAFKPEEYGKYIIIEKTIFNEEQAARLVLKNDKEKRVSERKQELDEMLDHFGIQINNPICILNQEVSKTFLHSKKPEDKFELFMKATNLEQIEEDYAGAREAHDDWDDCNKRRSTGFRILDNEYQTCKEKISFILNRYKLNETWKKLTNEIFWAAIRDLEEKAKQMEGSVSKLEQDSKTKQQAIMSKEEDIANLKLRVEQSSERIQSLEEECTKSKEKVSDLRSKENQLKTRKIDKTLSLEGDQRKLDRLNRDKTSLQKSIEDLKKSMESEHERMLENEKRKVEIVQLERERQVEQAREQTLRQHSDQINKSMTDTRGDMQKEMTRVNELKGNISAAKASLARLQAGQANEIRKYGEGMVRVVEEIERAHKAGRFKKKPLGPLGFLLKLKTPDIAQALELHLGKQTHAFTCDNIHDMTTLNKIIRDVRSNDYQFKEPLIITRRFCNRHNVTKQKAIHLHYKTMLDYIEIDEDAVFNALVDRACLEQVLFIPNYEEAQNLMLDTKSIPRGTRCAYTQDCHTMYPRTERGGFRCIANQRQNLCLFSKGNANRIREIKKDMEISQVQLNEAEARLESLKVSYEAQRSELTSNQHEASKIRHKLCEMDTKLLTLRTTIEDCQPQELSPLENELEATMAAIHETQVEIERKNLALTTLNDELEEISNQLKSAGEVLKRREATRLKENEAIGKDKDRIRSYEEEIKQLNRELATNEKNQADISKMIDALQEDISNSRQSKPDGFERPSRIRPTDEIRKEKSSVEAELNVEIDENEDPDEMIVILKKRMQEIERITAMKDHNMRNFSMTRKSLNDRREGFHLLKRITCNNVSTTFSSVMKAMGMTGLLTINLDEQVSNGQVISKARTLEMSIDTTPSQRPEALSMSGSNAGSPQVRRPSQSQHSDGPRSKRPRANPVPASEKENQKMTDTRSLSGGERSFSTVAFVLALWHHCASPFKLMDEIDVFMDMVTRKLSYDALIKFSYITDNAGQFLYFSPLELPKIDVAENMVRVFEMPHIERDGENE